MIDFAEAIKQISDHMTASYWRIHGLVARPKLEGFQEQQTEMPGFPVEFVRQHGDGDYGFCGDIYMPTKYPDGDGGVLYVHIEYSE